MDTVTSEDGTTIAYERHGDGPALVAVDAAMSYGAFRPLRPPVELAEHFTVYEYERRGRGASGDTRPYAVEREVEDLGAVISAAGGSAYVYAMSSGCLLALHAAARGVPIAKLVLFEPPYVARSTPVADSPYVATLRRLVGEGRRGEAVDYTMREIVGVPEDLLAGLPPEVVAAQEAVVHTMEYDCAVSETTTVALVRSVSVPTLVLASEASGPELAGMAELVAKELRRATFAAVAGEWHGPSPAALVEKLTAFLR